MTIVSAEQKKRSTNFQKIYRGAFAYTKNGVTYTQETFDVHRNKKDLDYHFDAQILSRVYTGELLKINVSYVIGNIGIPTAVFVQKSLGNSLVEETYNVQTQNNIIQYHYKSTTEERELEITTPPKFHITTPSAACCMTFISSKKIDQLAKNYYYSFNSPNQWSFNGALNSQSLVLVRTNIGEAENIKINGHNLQAVQYNIFADEQESKVNNKNKTAHISEDQTLNVYISKHLDIPYMISSSDGTKVEVKYLNHFEDDDEQIFTEG